MEIFSASREQISQGMRILFQQLPTTSGTGFGIHLLAIMLTYLLYIPLQRSLQ